MFRTEDVYLVDLGEVASILEADLDIMLTEDDNTTWRNTKEHKGSPSACGTSETIATGRDSWGKRSAAQLAGKQLEQRSKCYDVEVDGGIACQHSVDNGFEAASTVHGVAEPWRSRRAAEQP